MANGRRDRAKERRWREVLRRQAASGLSVRAFCRNERVSEAGFYAWRRVIGERDAEAGRAKPKTNRKPAKSTGQVPAFVPVVVRDVEPAELQAAAPTANASIVIELRHGRLLRLPGSITAKRLAELVQALEAEPAR